MSSHARASRFASTLCLGYLYNYLKPIPLGETRPATFVSSRELLRYQVLRRDEQRWTYLVPEKDRKKIK